MEPLGLACMVILMMHHLVNALPDSHSQARRHEYRGAALMDNFHVIASDGLLQGNVIFRSVTAVLLFLIYFTTRYFIFCLSCLFCS